MNPNGQNSYDFIMNPEQKRSTGPSFGGPQKLLMIVGLFAVVIVLIIVLFTVVFSSSGGNRSNLVSVSAHQTELTRVIELGIDNVVDQNLKQKFQTLLSAVTSDSREVSTLISAREFEVTKLDINAEKNTDVDKAFDEAIKKNDFDPVFEQSVTAATNEYFQSLKAALNGATSEREKELLNTALFNVQTIAQ